MKFLLLLLVTSLLIVQIQAQNDGEVQNDDIAEEEADAEETVESDRDTFDDKEVDWRAIRNRKLLTRSCACGVPNRPMIGATTALNRYPWAMQLTYIPPNSRTQKFFCGATLINNRYAVAAASCFNNITSPIFARIVRTAGTQSMGYVRMATVIQHPAYNPTTRNADIALLKFNSTISLGRGIVPVCLTRPNYPFQGRTAFTATWGQLAGGPISNSVRINSAPIISSQACSMMTTQLMITNTMLCVRSNMINNNAFCQSDNGGPLSVIDRMLRPSGVFVNRHKLAGVSSFGSGCNSMTTVPGVYTRVASFLDFITVNTLDGVYCAF